MFVTKGNVGLIKTVKGETVGNGDIAGVLLSCRVVIQGLTGAV
jgi:hypothetical protein